MKRAEENNFYDYDKRHNEWKCINVMIDTIKNQLNKMNINYDQIANLRSKDGVHLYKVQDCDKKYVLKYFENGEFRREIKNYLILQDLNVLTIPLIAYTDKAILMDDISHSSDMRLAEKEDMNSPDICFTLGKWYKNLHEKGKQYVKLNGDGMYMETDCITFDNIQIIKQKTNTSDSLVWKAIEEKLGYLREMIDKTEKTLTYNDFYYTNMAVSKEHGAFMFDYNLLGKGYIASDIKNVTVQLSEDAKNAFLKGYGQYNKKEELMHEVAGSLVALCFACQREIFPEWGYEELEGIKNGLMLENIEKLYKKLE